MLVRNVKHQGVFRWKKHDVFLSEVLWAERIGLLPVDDRWFTIYFAQLPIASFDSRELRVVAWRKPQGFDVGEEAGEGEASPSPAPLPLDAKPGESVRHVPGLICQECPRPFRPIVLF